MRLSIIVPVHNGGDHLRLCLKALSESDRPPDEIIAVDDASTDESAIWAHQAGARLVRLPEGPRGPAFARNRGAEVAQGDVIVFVDADVVTHADTLGRIERCLVDHPEVAALFGSYDDEPSSGTLVSRYKNLFHHYVHQHGRREAFTFWAGCGAVRREVFSSLGGFDERYTRPSIEDIELGARLRRNGYKVWLCPEIQVTHLKQWTLGSLLRADIFNRAIPWTRLMMWEGQVPAGLNLDAVSRVSAFVAWAGVAFAAAALWDVRLGLGGLLSLLVVWVLNRCLYSFFARKGGPFFAIGAAGLHLLYLLYSSAAFAIVVVLDRLKGLVVSVGGLT